MLLLGKSAAGPVTPLPRTDQVGDIQPNVSMSCQEPLLLLTHDFYCELQLVFAVCSSGESVHLPCSLVVILTRHSLASLVGTRSVLRLC